MGYMALAKMNAGYVLCPPLDKQPWKNHKLPCKKRSINHAPIGALPTLTAAIDQNVPHSSKSCTKAEERPAGFWRIPPSRQTIFALLVGMNLAGNGTHCTPRVSVIWTTQVPASREQLNSLALLLPDAQPCKGKLRVSGFESYKNEHQWLYSNLRILLAEIYIDWK